MTRPMHHLRDVTPGKKEPPKPLAVSAYTLFVSLFAEFTNTKEYRYIEAKLKPAAERAMKKALKPRAARGTITVRKLDEAFSIAIRMRDAATSGRCCTCSSFITFSNSDCGHYLGRQYWATRWHPMNCAAQCRKCNRFNEGMKAQFRAYLVATYGERIIAGIEAMHKQGRKPKAHEMAAIMERIKAI